MRIWFGRAPYYTNAARRAGLTGAVVVESIIGEDGRVYQTTDFTFQQP